MKLLLAVAFGIAVVVLLAPGCKKGNSTDTYSPNMIATINDSVFSVTDPSQISASKAVSGTNTYLYIYGESGTGELIKISIINNTGPATIQFVGSNASAYYYPSGLTNPYSQAVSGSVTLTSVTPSLVGTFNFTCADGTQVKNGSFLVLAP